MEALLETGRDRTVDLLRRVLPRGTPLRASEGWLAVGDRCLPVTKGVVRFRSEDGYNASFALQWKRFRLNQYDHVNGTSLTAQRFLAGTGWPRRGLEGEIILEAGCGAGRFTRILAETGATVVAFDYSSAVDVSAEVNGPFTNMVFLQADILDMPFRDGAFDRVFCHGVLQHTPDPARAFRALHRVLRPGGLMSVDVYLKDGKVRPWKSKYLWRPLTTRLDPERLLAFLAWFIPKWLPIDTRIKQVPVLGNYLGALVPCWNYHGTELSPQQKREWAVMDTFDALASAHDNPVTREEVEGWFREAGYVEFEVREGGNGLLGNGRKGPGPGR